MALEQVTLRDLIESRAAQNGIAARALWLWALEAISGGALPPPESVSLDEPFNHGGLRLTWRVILKTALHTIDVRDPSRNSWAMTLKLKPRDFDRWLKKEKRVRQIGTSPHRVRGPKPTKREQLASFIENNYRHDLPPYKQIARDFKTSTNISVDERTVRRARGFK